MHILYCISYIISCNVHWILYNKCIFKFSLMYINFVAHNSMFSCNCKIFIFLRCLNIRLIINEKLSIVVCLLTTDQCQWIALYYVTTDYTLSYCDYWLVCFIVTTDYPVLLWLLTTLSYCDYWLVCLNVTTNILFFIFCFPLTFVGSFTQSLWQTL